VSTQTTAVTTATTKAAAGRDPWFDNAKLVLVTLVVVGHAWTLLPPTQLHQHLYDFLYLWHVPAFVFITGYLGRSFAYTHTKVWQMVRTVVVPYLCFEAALALFRIYVGGEELRNLFTDPHWPMWYLAALFFWRLLTTLMQRIPGVLAVSVVVSLVGGAVAPTTFDLARVCGLLPFFVLGLLATPERLEVLRLPATRAFGVLALVALWRFAGETDTVASTEWLYYRSTYDAMGAPLGEAVATRLGVLALGATGAFAALSLIPTRRTRLTRMGEMSLVVYLCHGFVVLAARYAGYGSWTDAHPVLGLLLTTAAAVGVSLALASRPLSRHLRHAVDPLAVVEDQYASRHERRPVRTSG
jgi:fucose 4-O-acetylase-like acetyltransferase